MKPLKNKLLFFTTSPRTPSKMIPEIQLLTEKFSGKPWNKKTQEKFIDKLAQSDFFEGNGSPSDKAFSARDRINRAPKSLGFVDLSPKVELTDAGKAFIYGKRPQEIYLRQLLKFQLPSPYHGESKEIKGTFNIRPYLEIIRLVRELGYLTFDEFKIFALQLTDYNDFERIKDLITEFRNDVRTHRGQYKKLVNDTWVAAILEIYSDRIAEGKTKTRESNDKSLKNFIRTQKRNMRDYADAGFRYLRYTGLIDISQHQRSISISPNKVAEVDFILETVDRDPVFIDDEINYKQHLFSADSPVLYTDNKNHIIEIIMNLGTFEESELESKSLEELKDLRDALINQHKEEKIEEEITNIKSRALYPDIMKTFDGIIAGDYYDVPLMFEYNTWRAMTMLDGGDIKGNFKIDDNGDPLSTASGNMPDIECDYQDFVLSVEVTMQAGQRQYESEGEPVARHYGKLKQQVGKETYCIFIAPKINSATYAHFYGLNHIPVALYGGKSKIIPLSLDQFIKLVENSYNNTTQPESTDVKKFLDTVIEQCASSSDEDEWKENIQNCVEEWLIA